MAAWASMNGCYVGPITPRQCVSLRQDECLWLDCQKRSWRIDLPCGLLLTGARLPRPRCRRDRRRRPAGHCQAAGEGLPGPRADPWGQGHHLRGRQWEGTRGEQGLYWRASGVLDLTDGYLRVGTNSIKIPMLFELQRFQKSERLLIPPALLGPPFLKVVKADLRSGSTTPAGLMDGVNAVGMDAAVQRVWHPYVMPRCHQNCRYDTDEIPSDFQV